MYLHSRWLGRLHGLTSFEAQTKTARESTAQHQHREANDAQRKQSVEARLVSIICNNLCSPISTILAVGGVREVGAFIDDVDGSTGIKRHLFGSDSINRGAVPAFPPPPSPSIPLFGEGDPPKRNRKRVVLRELDTPCLHSLI